MFLDILHEIIWPMTIIICTVLVLAAVAKAPCKPL